MEAIEAGEKIAQTGEVTKKEGTQREGTVE